MKLKQIRVDGYKNLINCVLNLGDFNVLVGPNNSGKTNFLEILPTLFGIFYGQEALTTVRSETPFHRPSTFFCNLNGYENIGLKMQVIFDTGSRRQSWRIHYDVSITRKSFRSIKSKDKFLINAETLKGKPPNRPGPWNIFLNREPKTLRINTEATSKQHAIGNTISAFEFTRSMYPELDDLGKNFKSIVSGLINVCHTHVLALDPGLLRGDLGKEGSLIPWIRLPYFDILSEIDQIHNNKKLYRLFEDAVCDILDLEGLHFVGKNIHAGNKGKGKGEFVKRLRSLAIKKRGTSYSSIENYSDGTLVAIAILSALLSKNRESSMLCIEEPENYLHPRALEKLVRFLQDHAHKWPVLITTHSPYLLNCVNPEDVNVAIVDETGAAHFEKVHNTKQLRDYLKSGFISFGDMLASNFEDVLGK